jgi:microcystin-dependent protein
MAEPFLAEIKIVGFNFAPRGFAFCDGQILPINQNQSLFSLLGTSYGGDGRIDFALPDLRGRVPVHVGASPGGHGGSHATSATVNNMPAHSHSMHGTAEAAGDLTAPAAGLLAKPNGRRTAVPYGRDPGGQPMKPTGTAGASVPITNIQPSIALSFCIALQGLFPSRN